MDKSDLDCNIEIIEKMREMYEDYIYTDITIDFRTVHANTLVEIRINGELENSFILDDKPQAKLIWEIAETLKGEK